jgi:methylated-DNA-[protein]-cysteine S-methyltransferase
MVAVANVRNGSSLGVNLDTNTSTPKGNHMPMTTALRSRTTQTPVGELFLVASDDGLVALLWPGEPHISLASTPDVVQHGVDKVLDAACQQLGEYFAGTRTDFDLPLAPTGTEFQLSAWEALRRIPFGETRSYAFQASAIDRPKAVRAVGAANGRNPISIIVPCHRVIGTNGSLTGFGGGIETKKFLLDHERHVLGLEPLGSGRTGSGRNATGTATQLPLACLEAPSSDR